MASHEAPIEVIRDRAARWVQRVNDNELTDAERGELHAWLLADPRHAVEFRAHNALLGLARELPTDVRARLDAYLPVLHQEARPTRNRRRWFALAASALLTLMSGWLFFTPTYATHTGENRTVTFDNGSVAYLNTRTKIEYSSVRTHIRQIGGKCERLVYLQEGEALFDVVHDPTCPFVVVIGNTEIRVLGTRFNVYRKPNGEVTVTVLEGKVAVRELGADASLPAWKREVSANQRIVFQTLGLMDDVQDVDTTNVARWRDGLLIASEQIKLPKLLEELSRYTNKRIVIRNPNAAKVMVGGVFSVRDVGSALRRIDSISPVDVTETGETFTLDYHDK